MTRHATPYGAFNIEPMPSQPQIGLCHGFFVDHALRGRGLGHELKRTQHDALADGYYDYAICTCDSANTAQQRVLTVAGWQLLDHFENSRTGGKTQIWGRQVPYGIMTKPEEQA